MQTEKSIARRSPIELKANSTLCVHVFSFVFIYFGLFLMIWVSGFQFLVSACIFNVLNSYFECLDLYFECLDLYFECLDLCFGCPNLYFGCPGGWSGGSGD